MGTVAGEWPRWAHLSWRAQRRGRCGSSGEFITVSELTHDEPAVETRGRTPESGLGETLDASGLFQLSCRPARPLPGDGPQSDLVMWAW